MKLLQALLCVISVLAIGCGESGPPTGTVEGKVTFGGSPPPEPVLISFTNSETGQGGAATTGDDGTFELPFPIHVGEYTVYFEKIVQSDGPISTEQEQLKLIPAEYRNELSSPLKEKVEEGSNTIDIDVPKAE